LSLATGQNFKEGAESLKIAIRLAPQNKHLLLNLAQLQARMKEYESAKKTLNRCLAQMPIPG
jgi:tetratricopeptide (TPR) repeat protein